MKFPKLSHKVLAILRDQPQTRNDDIDLTLWIWYEYFREHLEWQEPVAPNTEGRWIVSLTSVRALPSEDKISRFRRKINEASREFPEGRYRATDPVVLARRMKEERVRSTIKTTNWAPALE
jgi:acyl dehydratase